MQDIPTHKSEAALLHDLLNHLRDQPKDSSGHDMLIAAQEFVSEWEYGAKLQTSDYST